MTDHQAILSILALMTIIIALGFRIIWLRIGTLTAAIQQSQKTKAQAGFAPKVPLEPKV